ncbi:bifunctional diguanylate cyclase/phosphodiesterase [Deinococcus sp. 6GRE01]|uniref:putative bifunctional diguanylate cyclase/phosphodiesterase n=1 Tax=Deinococcus sp. 6GRE01 TaxID=2745873 RepID=UPI001E4D64D9|nr:EAL domain-containing protein [Deinococcus sp. 6GRE01]MCD0155762.1 EAL domain-containing protein [Deinococcus sp. 6GRE01]
MSSRRSWFRSFRTLSLRRQANLLVVAVLVPTVILQAVAVPNLLLQRFRSLEQRQLTATGETLTKAYAREDARLRAFTKNFAAWSETYRFAQGLNPGFLNSNLVPSTFEGGNVNIWGVIDRAGQVLSAATYSPPEIQRGEAAGVIVRELVRWMPSDPAQTASGLVAIGDRYYLTASQPITQDDGTGLAGRFLLARELTPEVLTEVVPLGQDSQLSLVGPGITTSAPNLLTDQLALPVMAPDGAPSATLQVTQTRFILAAGRAAISQIALITALSTLLTLLLGVTFIRRQVLQVVEQYDRDVQQMRRDSRHRLTVRGDDELGRLGVTINDLTDQYRRQYAEIQSMHQRDGLTGLLNREGLTRRSMPQSLRAAAVIQVGSLESLSGLYGAVRTDRLLMEFAARLREHAPSAFCARLRSDTFALLCGQRLDTLMPAVHAASAPYAVNTGEMQLRVHVGLVDSEELKSADELLECAELALQESHDFGEPARTYTRQTRQRLERARALQESLRIFTDDTFTLHYQPIVDLNGQVPVSFEALLRWTHPQLGFISPAEFIPLAERGGHIYAIGQWVLRQAASDLLRSGHPTLKVNVNVSPLQLLSPSFAQDTLQALGQLGLPATQLVLEVTESAVLENLDLATAHLNALREAGIQIALDDFGAGYSSLSLLSRLPVDVIKLDRTFLTEALTERSARSVLAQVVVLATQLGFPVVAEGIENQDTLTLLREMGVRRGQGYLLGRPVPYADSLGRLGRRD